MNFLKYVFLLFLCLPFGTVSIKAQSTADKLYNEGLSHQKIKTFTSQNLAIAKFTSARNVYDSKANKDKCTAAIRRSKQIINGIVPGTNPNNNPSNNKSADHDYNQGLHFQEYNNVSSQEWAIKYFESALGKYKNVNDKNKCRTAIAKSNMIINKLGGGKDVFKLEKTKFETNCLGEKLVINVECTDSIWNAAVVLDENGESFISVEKNASATAIEIEFEENIKTKERKQIVELTSENGKPVKIEIVQQGRPVILKASKTDVEFGYARGKKKIDIYCNADETYKDNDGCNWTIIGKPVWIRNVKVVKKQSKGGVLGWIGNVASSAKNKINQIMVGKQDVPDDPSIIVTTIQIEVDENNLKDRNIYIDREGDIVIATSQHHELIISVRQKRRKY